MVVVAVVVMVAAVAVVVVVVVAVVVCSQCYRQRQVVIAPPPLTDFQQVKLLLQGKADPNQLDELGRSCLHVCALSPSATVVDSVSEVITWWVGGGLLSWWMSQ